MKFDINEQEALASAVRSLPIRKFEPGPTIDTLYGYSKKFEKPDPTVYTVHAYSDQEVFDFVVTRVIAQGVPGIAYDGERAVRCVLLNRAGHRCAIGMLVPGDEGLDKASLPGHIFASGVLGHLMNAHDSAATRSRRYTSDFVMWFRINAAAVAVLLDLNPACAYA